jgi:N-acetylglucosamine-6-phosphate deacetylase
MDPNLPDGEHQWGTRPGATFRKEGHAVYVGGTTTLAGSCCPLNECLRNLSNYASIPLPEAILTTTLRPAQMLGPSISQHKGKLEEGFDADLCVLGWDGSVKSTWIMGQEVWRAEELGDVGEGDYLGSVSADKKGLVNGH